jgi:hypothetical protein
VFAPQFHAQVNFLSHHDYSLSRIVDGKNYLTFGGGGTATYIYETHGSYPVTVSASATISKSDLNKGTDTTSCTQSYSRMLDDDGVQVTLPPLIFLLCPPLMIPPCRIVMLVISLLIVLAAGEIKQSISSLKISALTAAPMLSLRMISTIVSTVEPRAPS